MVSDYRTVTAGIHMGACQTGKNHKKANQFETNEKNQIDNRRIYQSINGRRGIYQTAGQTIQNSRR